MLLVVRYVASMYVDSRVMEGWVLCWRFIYGKGAG
jgi:hypothetical protein